MKLRLSGTCLKIPKYSAGRRKLYRYELLNQNTFQTFSFVVLFPSKKLLTANSTLKSIILKLYTMCMIHVDIFQVFHSTKQYINMTIISILKLLTLQALVMPA